MIRGLWDRETVAALLIAAALPIAAAWLLAGGWGAAGRLLLVALTVGLWQLVWMLVRAQPPSVAGLVTALTIAILAPGELGAFAFLFGISFGLIFGELAFGGWGRNPLNPAAISLAFLGFGFATAPWPDLPVQIGWAAIPALAIGVLTGVFSPRLVLAALAVFGAAVWAATGVEEMWVAFAVVLALLVSDPVASAATQAGRWMNGALYAGLTALFHASWSHGTDVQIAVSAALLASLVAPLLDEIALAVWRAQRSRRFE